jgi:hypothetical protein
MRRALVSPALLALAFLSMSGAASAAPAVTFKARAVPIPRFRGTGNILGAGAALQVEYTIRGTEYGGFPPPLVGVNFYTPAGTRLHPRGFVSCSPSALKSVGPRACPRKSRVTILGEALGVVSFGNERVQEKASIQAFFAPGGALQFFTSGSTPVSLEFLSPSRVVAARRPYAQEFITTVPLIETVPGAPDASTLSIKVKVGAAFRKGRRVVYYGTVPRRCPKGGFPLKSELLFAGIGGLAPQTVPVTYKAPCPRGSRRAHRARGGSRRPHRAAKSKSSRHRHRAQARR